MAGVNLPRPASRHVAKPGGRSKDDLVMATNSSSIVSKRSVERLYYPNEPHFFRFFVKKFQRRAPLINRGYHLRLHVIDTLVRRFLEEPSARKKVVVNLGCGSDVLPWQCLSRYPEACKNAVFVDVDFPDLLSKKREIVLSTRELVSPLENLQSTGDGPILLRSNQYVQIGCDLRDTETLQRALSCVADLGRARVFFVAEVSITYMETEAADGLIKWASTVGQSEFCLLEQFLPDGPQHPFAETMIRHFEKLNTPLRSIMVYPTVETQEKRFLNRGWLIVRAWSLWQAWTDDIFLTSTERQKLDDVEPFDEWDELALFASHYVVLHAGNDTGALQPLHEQTSRVPDVPSFEVATSYKEFPNQRVLRRFAAPMIIKNSLGYEFIANFMGHGVHSRLRSCDIYSKVGCTVDFSLDRRGPESRMSHTFTDLGFYGILLAGGRSSPTSPRKDCWLFKNDHYKWTRVDDLPSPLYRHSTTRLEGTSFALLYGGKSGSHRISDKTIIYVPREGWRNCIVTTQTRPAPVFGAIVCCTGRTGGKSTKFIGVLAGGMLQDGSISDQVLTWEADLGDVKKPTISFMESLITSDTSGEAHGNRLLLARFGAAWTRYRDHFLILGGVLCHGLVPKTHEILVCSLDSSTCKINYGICNSNIFKNQGIPRPLITGSSVITTEDGEVVLIGGGATCFSMGTFWTKGIYTFTLDLRVHDTKHPRTIQSSRGSWVLGRTVEFVDGDEATIDPSAHQGPKGISQVLPIQRTRLQSSESFEDILKASTPVILEGLDLGPATKKWNLDYLANQVGKDKKVVVHEAETRNMDFNAKNFRYVTKSFESFAEEVKLGGRLYLRALASDEPAGKPAELGKDFPALGADFILPPELAFVAENSFSSVLRISGPVDMWLHYDVMANIYCQISGAKRLILFPPSDVGLLSFAPGASSSSIDIFRSLDSSALSGTHPQEAILGPGDILFLPPLWLHTATPLASNASIAVNVFFRNLESGYSTGRDVYGNRDLAAYENGRQILGKVANAFKNVPADARDFYIQRLANELLLKAKE